MSTPQDTFDALASYLTEKDVIEIIVEGAMGYLAYDDANPDVGMGMFYGEAVNLAAKSLKAEAERWGRKVHIGDGTIEKAEAEVRKLRRNR